MNTISGRSLSRAVLALSAAFACSMAAHAQQPAAPLDLTVPATTSASDAVFSSSSADNANVVAANRFDFVNVASEMQPPPRRYGRPRYRGGNTNPDGSNKYAFLAGAGFTQPVGNTYHYYKPSYSFQVGGGRNFNKTVGVMLQFDWDNLGVNNRTLQTFSLEGFGDANTADTGLSAHAHVWSFTLDPVYNITPSNGGLGAYLVGGAGFYHKDTQFTQVGNVCGYDYYYGYVCYTANSPFQGGTYNSNAVGFNGGLGLTYKISRFSNERLYGEIRYVVTLNSQRPGVTLANYTTYAGNNYFPANANRTTYLPVKFGIRF
jgi:hypothetical protein